MFPSLVCIHNALIAGHQRLLAHNLAGDNTAIAQASLLLSLHSTISDQTLNSTWLAKAITHAKAADAHVYFRAPASDDGHRLVRKRLWWCCILRDRMIAVGSRRNVQIMPTEFDLNQAGLTEADMGDQRHSSQVYSAETTRYLAQIVTAQCALAVAMTDTLILAYGEDDVALATQSCTTAQLVSSMVKMERAKTELLVWARTYMPILTSRIGKSPDSEANPSAALFADLTLIHY